MCFMSVVALLVMDMRTGALQESVIQPSQCYNCYANDTTSCEQSSSWTLVTCPTKTPLCATIASVPDFRSSLACVSEVNNSCIIKTLLNSSLVMTCVCKTHLCNAPFTSEWRAEVLKFVSNNSDIRQENVYELLSKFTNNTEEEKFYKAVTKEMIETATRVVMTASQSYTLVPITATMNIHSILRDSERPRAESLKQEPTVPSDDDEDEGEGSGSYEESRIRNHPVSAPAAPSSLLPANENNANLLCKKLFISLTFVVILIDLV